MDGDKKFLSKEAIVTMKKDLSWIGRENRESRIAEIYEEDIPAKPAESKTAVLQPQESTKEEKLRDLTLQAQQEQRQKDELERKREEELEKTIAAEMQKQAERKQPATEESPIMTRKEQKARKEEALLADEIMRRHEMQQKGDDAKQQLEHEDQRQAALQQQIDIKKQKEAAEQKKREETRWQKIEEERRQKERVLENLREEACQIVQTERIPGPGSRRRILFQERQKTNATRNQLRGEIRRIENEKRPLSAKKNELLRAISGLEKIFQAIALKEESIEESEKNIEEKELAAATPQDKRRLEKERWILEARRQELEKQRWPGDEKINQLEEQLKDINERYARLENQCSEIKAQEADIVGQEQGILAGLKKIDLAIKIQNLEQLQKTFEQQQDKIAARLQQIEDLLNQEAGKERDIETSKSLIEAREKAAQDRREKSNIERERWAIESQRKQIEAERWKIEREKQQLRFKADKTASESRRIAQSIESALATIGEINRKFGPMLEKILSTSITKAAADSPASEPAAPFPLPKKMPQPISQPPKPQPVQSAQKPPPTPPASPNETTVPEDDEQKRLAEARARVEALKKELAAKQPPESSVASPKPTFRATTKPETPASPGQVSSKPGMPFPGEGIERLQKPLSPKEKPYPEAKISTIMGAIPKKPSSGDKLWVRILVTIFVLVLFTSIISFWFWYLVIRKQNPTPGCQTSADCPAGYLCSPGGLCTSEVAAKPCTTPADCPEGYACATEGKCVAVSDIPSPDPFFRVEATRVFPISTLQEVRPALVQLLAETKTAGQFTYIVFKNIQEKKVLGLKDFTDAMQIALPSEFSPKVQDQPFTLFMFSQTQGNRLGLAVKINDKNGLTALIREKELDLQDDYQTLLGLLTLEQAPVTRTFKNASQYRYQGPNFRFQTITQNDIGICYIVSDNYFIFTTSWDSMVNTIQRAILRPIPLVITKELKYGMSDNEVETLQTWLSQDYTIYPEHKVTGYFDLATRNAVIRFQEKYTQDILAPQGLTKGNGIVDILTRNKLNQLYSNSVAP